MPYYDPVFLNKIAWSRVSNAFDRSKNIAIGMSPLSRFCRRVSVNSIAAVSVECNFLKPVTFE